MSAQAHDMSRQKIATLEAGSHEAEVLFFIDITNICQIFLDELKASLDDWPYVVGRTLGRPLQ